MSTARHSATDARFGKVGPWADNAAQAAVGDRPADLDAVGSRRQLGDELPGRDGGVLGRPIEVQQALGRTVSRWHVSPPQSQRSAWQ